MARFKAEQITIFSGNIVLIDVFYQLLLVIGDSIFVVRFKLGYEVLDLMVLDAKNSGCRADGYFILDYSN